MFSEGRALAVRAVKGTAALADYARPPARGAVVLIYHRVGGPPGLEIDLPVAAFRAQMQALAAARVPRNLDDALRCVAGDPPLMASDDPVVITFDDGTADFADRALPVICDHRVPVTLYLATDFVERGVPFPRGGAPLSWSALRDALSTGLVTVGSHTHTHALLDRLSPSAVDEELDRSVGLIEDRLGVAASHFAYPKAVAPSTVAAVAVGRRFRSAALAGTKPNRYGRTDPLRLARSPVQVSDGMRFFRRKLSGGMALEDALRRGFNRRRYAGAAT